MTISRRFFALFAVTLFGLLLVFIYAAEKTKPISPSFPAITISPAPHEMISVTQVVTGDIMYRSISQYSAGSTPLDALQKEYNITTMALGPMEAVESINGKIIDHNSSWELYINSRRATSKEVNTYILEEGDIIEWKYEIF